MMKKGFLLTLLVVAMVAMALPAGARAPIVHEIPDIIIGDSEDYDPLTGESLPRFLDIVEFESPSLIERRNGTDRSNLSVYYASYTIAGDEASVKVKASTTESFVDPLTSLDRLGLISGIQPPASKLLNAATTADPAGHEWLSLMNTFYTSATLPSDAYSATTADDGVAPVNYEAGWDAATTLVIVAFEQVWDGAATVPLVASNDSTVLCVTGVFDALGATSPTVVWVFDGSTMEWTHTPPGASPDYLVAQGTYLLNYPKFDALAGNSVPLFGTFQTGDGAAVLTVIDADEENIGSDQIFTVSFTLQGSAATAAAGPGYRLFAAAQLFTHLSGVVAFTYEADGTGIHTPTAAQNITMQFSVAVPYELTQYADGELLSDFSSVNTGLADIRDYVLLFELVDWEDTDAGQIGVAGASVIVEPRPFSLATPTIEWGSGGIPFDNSGGANPAQWYGGTTVMPGFDLGAFTRSPESVEIGPNTTTGYSSTGPTPDGFGASVPWVAGQLTRFAGTWASITNTAQSPTLRQLAFVFSTENPIRSIFTQEQYGGMTAKFLMAQVGATSLIVPGMPKGTGSTIEYYHYSHNGPGADAWASKLYPTIDCYSAGLYDGTPISPATTAFPPENGRIRLTRFTVEADI